MKNRAPTLSILLASLAFLTLNHQLSTVFAQGTAFTYQGQLENSGVSANGTYNLQFSLYIKGTGGAAVAGPVTNNGVLVTNGLFTVTIDFGSAVWNGATNWLQIGVQTNGATSFSSLAPRQQVTPTPYAIYAEGANAAGLNGTVPMSSLSGTYGGALSLTNAGDSFTGDGSGLANVDAATLGGLAAGNFWQTGGNSGVPTGNNYIGNNDNQYLDIHANGVRAFRFRLFPDGLGLYTNAPNVIGGSSVNLTAPNVVGATVAGGGGNGTNGSSLFNEVYADFGTIGGGAENRVGSLAGTVSGGFGNVATNLYAMVGGGVSNNASGIASFVGGGGYDNFNPIAGNTASGHSSVVCGGVENTSAAMDSVICGGFSNSIGYYSYFAFIGSGAQNSAGYYDVVGGGYQNSAISSYCTVGGGIGNQASDYADFSTIGGGTYNVVSGDFSFIGGGCFNTNAGQYSVICGGASNYVSAVGSFIGGGGYDGVDYGGNLIFANAATICGGWDNYIPPGSRYAFIGGGANNEATAYYATVGGGAINYAEGEWATIPGGFGNDAYGANSFAAGSYATAYYDGSFVWSDASALGFIDTFDTSSNQFVARASGGFFFYSGTGSSGVKLASGATSWTTLCDRNAKKNFKPVDTVAVLEKLASVPIEQWNYKWEKDSATPNIGPMAQDFKAAFYPGRDDKGITTLEFDGVELAAIQGLNRKLDEAEKVEKEKDTEIANLKARLDALEKIVLKQNPN